MTLPTPDQIRSRQTAKKLRAMAGKFVGESEWMDRAGQKKNAAVWRGYARTCLKAAALLAERPSR